MDRVDEHGRLGALPLFEQPERLALLLAHGDPRRLGARRAAAAPPQGPPRRHGAASCPTPITTTDARRPASVTIDCEPEEVGRARDARIVVADRLLAAQGELLVGEIEAAFDDRAQILLDRELVLRGGRHDPGVEDRAVLVDLVAVVEQAPWGLGGAVPDCAARDDLDGGRVRRLVARR